jgi:hypothetical protein
LKKRSRSFVPGLFLALICLAPLHAQSVSEASARNNTSTAAQAPDEMTNKITSLVDAGKYAEAQQLTTGLLVAYPDDQRLIKAKALLEKLIAAPGTPNAAPGNEQKPWAANASAETLTGEDKLDLQRAHRVGAPVAAEQRSGRTRQIVEAVYGAER